MIKKEIFSIFMQNNVFTQKYEFLEKDHLNMIWIWKHFFASASPNEISDRHRCIHVQKMYRN